MKKKRGGVHESVASLLPRECWKSYCELEQSILLNKGFDERRGSVLIWIRNLCLRAPFLSRLPSTTPLWFKAVFGFSSASQVITFQHVAPFRGGINQSCYFFIPHTPGPRGTEKKRKKGKKREGKKRESIFWHCHFLHIHMGARAVWAYPVPSDRPLRWSSLPSTNFASSSGGARRIAAWPRAWFFFLPSTSQRQRRSGSLSHLTCQHTSVSV